MALEDSDLVAQDEDLGVLSAVGPGEQGTHRVLRVGRCGLVRSCSRVRSHERAGSAGFAVMASSCRLEPSHFPAMWRQRDEFEEGVVSSSAAVMPRVPGRAARRGTGRRRGGTYRRHGGAGRRGVIRRRHSAARSRARRARVRRRQGCWRDRDLARPRRSRRHCGGRSCRSVRHRIGRRAVAARRAVAGHQQRDRDGAPDDDEGRSRSGQGYPEACLL